MESESSEDASGPRPRDSDDPKSARLSDGRRVSYAEYGDSAGTPVVVLHGTPGSRLLGRLLADPARRAGVRLLALDRPGYGRSSPWPERTLADTGEFVSAVLDDAGASRACVVGFSGGGPHALALAATHGDRVRTVDVVAGALPPSVSESVPLPMRLFGSLAAKTPRLLRGVARLQRWVAERASPSLVVSQYTSPDGRAALSDGTAELVRRDFVEAFANHRSGFVTGSRLLAREWDFPLEAIDERVHLWYGGRDANVPAEAARRLADRLPDARLTVLAEADHLHALLESRSRILERHGSAT